MPTSHTLVDPKLQPTALQPHNHLRVPEYPRTQRDADLVVLKSNMPRNNDNSSSTPPSRIKKVYPATPMPPLTQMPTNRQYYHQTALAPPWQPLKPVLTAACVSSPFPAPGASNTGLRTTRTAPALPNEYENDGSDGRLLSSAVDNMSEASHSTCPSGEVRTVTSIKSGWSSSAAIMAIEP
jgi:hypothetical protein